MISRPRQHQLAKPRVKRLANQSTCCRKPLGFNASTALRSTQRFRQPFPHFLFGFLNLSFSMLAWLLVFGRFSWRLSGLAPKFLELWWVVPLAEMSQKCLIRLAGAPTKGHFYDSLFPRASERRVLLIVEVCHHIFSSHLHIFTSSHFILSSSHPHIFTSSHVIFSPSSSHLHIFTFHPLIFTSSHLYIFSCHLLTTFTSSHLFTSSHIFLLTSSHLHIFSLLPSCFRLALLPSCLLFLFSISKARGSANEAPRNATLSHEMRFDRQKLNNCDFETSAATLSHEMRFDRQKLR